jgi:hypothetical protein
VQEISGNNLELNNLTVNNSGSDLSLQNDIILSGLLTMSNGDLELNDNVLLINSGGSITGENSNSVIKSTASGDYIPNNDAGDGYIQYEAIINSGENNNIAGMGISINPSENFGNTVIERHHQRIVGTNGDNSLFRTYKITPTNSANLEADITITYEPSIELNGNNNGFLKIHQLNTLAKSDGNWTELNSMNTSPNVSATTIDNNLNILELAIAGQGSILPVSLLRFSSSCQSDFVEIKWETASEQNNDYFVLEKSADGFNFTTVATLKGAGNSNATMKYHYNDFQLTPNPCYYQLTQVDFDGNVETLKKIISQCDNEDYIQFQVENPVNNQVINIDLSTNYSSFNFSIKMIDMSGKLIFNKATNSDFNTWHIPVGALSSGIYNLIFEFDNSIITKRIIL